MKFLKDTSSRLILFIMAMTWFAGCGDNETILDPDTKPEVPFEITRIEPLSGVIGFQVKIYGRNFVPDFQVGTLISNLDEIGLFFNGIEAMAERLYQESEDLQYILTHVPEGASSGTVSVTIEGKTATSVEIFEVITPTFPDGAVPTISSFFSMQRIGRSAYHLIWQPLSPSCALLHPELTQCCDGQIQ